MAPRRSAYAVRGRPSSRDQPQPHLRRPAAGHLLDAGVDVELADQAEVDVHEALALEARGTGACPAESASSSVSGRAARRRRRSGPAGDDTRTRRPAKASVRSSASLRRVCPSGIRVVAGRVGGGAAEGGLRQRRQLARLVVGRRAGRCDARGARRRRRPWRGRPRRSGSCPRPGASARRRRRRWRRCARGPASRSPPTRRARTGCPRPCWPRSARRCRSHRSRRRGCRDPRRGRRPLPRPPGGRSRGSRRGRRRRTVRGRRPRSRGRPTSQEVVLQLEAGVVGAQVNAHGESLAEPDRGDRGG